MEGITVFDELHTTGFHATCESLFQKLPRQYTQQCGYEFKMKLYRITNKSQLMSKELLILALM